MLLAAGCAQSPGAGFTAVPPIPVASAVPPVASVAAVPTGPSAESAAGAALVLRVAAGTPADALVSVDAVSGRTLARLPIGVPDAAWSTLFVASPAVSPTATTLRALNVRTGTELRRTDLPGSWALPSVVPGGLPTGLAEAAGRLVLVASGWPADRGVVAAHAAVRHDGGGPAVTASAYDSCTSGGSIARLPREDRDAWT